MEYDFQRADLMKRLPAWILDTILLVVLITGFAALWSLAFSLDATTAEYRAIVAQYNEEFEQQAIKEYEETYGTKWPDYYTDEEAWNQLSEEDRLKAQEIAEQISKNVEDQTLKAMQENAEAQELLIQMISKGLSIISLSVLGAYVILEFIVPLLLKNGQTLGKKCFGIALMRKDGVKVTAFMMFARSVLGKCTVETMLPICLIGAAFMFGGTLWLIAAIALVLATVILTVVTKNKTAIHDLMACTVAVDMGSQMIFDSVEEMEAHNAQIRESVASWEA